MGYQIGTPDEGRSSAIAGETRARTERLFSAFREFGPGDATFTAALTYGFPYRHRRLRLRQVRVIAHRPQAPKENYCAVT